MERIMFHHGDVVYDDVSVPKGLSIEEIYYPEQNHIIIRIVDGQNRKPISMYGFNHDNPLEVISRETMRKMIVSGFIDHYRN